MKYRLLLLLLLFIIPNCMYYNKGYFWDSMFGVENSKLTKIVRNYKLLDRNNQQVKDYIISIDSWLDRNTIIFPLPIPCIIPVPAPCFEGFWVKETELRQMPGTDPFLTTTVFVSNNKIDYRKTQENYAEFLEKIYVEYKGKENITPELKKKWRDKSKEVMSRESIDKLASIDQNGVLTINYLTYFPDGTSITVYPDNLWDIDKTGLGIFSYMDDIQFSNCNEESTLYLFIETYDPETRRREIRKTHVPLKKVQQ